MRHRPRLPFIAALLFAGCLLPFSSCRKAAPDEDTGYASDHAGLEKTFSDVQYIADEAGTTGGLANYRMIMGDKVLGSCATVTNDTSPTPHVLVIDFGTANCLCADGIYRRGKIIVHYTGRYRDAGHSHTITFNGYFVNDNSVNGTKTVTQSAADSLGNPVYDITVNGSIVRADGSGTVSWTSTRRRTWLSGFATPGWKDDVFSITGNGTITRANGKTFSIRITTPLHVAKDCRWIESGIVEITPQGENARILDYGNTGCDAQASYTVNGKTHAITLK